MALHQSTVLEALAEADRRGILPPEKKAAFDEARRRGILDKVIDENNLNLAQGFTPKKPETVGELTGGIVTRPLIGGLMAVGGTALGSPAGPLGAAAGGALGVMAGEPATNTLEAALRSGGLLGGQNPTLTEVAGSMAQEGLIDVTLAGAGSVIRPILGMRATIAKLFGVTTRQSQELQGLARATGLELGAIDVGGEAPKTLARVLSVFPYTGTPIKRGGREKEKQVVRLFGEFLDSMAPNAILRNELGVDLSKAAGQRFGAFSRISVRLVKKLDDTIVAAGDPAIVPTDSVRQTATEFLEKFLKGEVNLQSGKKFKGAVADKVMQTIEQFVELPERITTSQYRARVKDLRLLMDEVQKSGGGDFAEAFRLKVAFEVDFNNLDLSVVGREAATAIQSAQTTFNTFYSKTAAQFETATAKRFGRFDRNVFGPGPLKASSLNADEIGDVALNLRSADAVGDLENVVGTGALKRAIREKFESAADLALGKADTATGEIQVLSIAKFRKEFGIVRRASTQEGVAEALKRSGIDPRSFDDFLAVAEKIENVSGPKTFIARRLTLGGARAGAALGGFGVAAATSGRKATKSQNIVLKALTLTFVARRLSEIIASPEALKNMTTALDFARSSAARRQGFLRATRAVGLELKRRRDEKETNKSETRFPSTRRPVQETP